MGAPAGKTASALDAALTDEDASVRAYAVQALAMRGEPEVMGIYGGPCGTHPPRFGSWPSRMRNQRIRIALLQEALSDVNETVRSMAANRLNQEPHRVDTK